MPRAYLAPVLAILFAALRPGAAAAQPGCVEPDVVPPSVEVSRPVATYTLADGWVEFTVAEACGLSWSDACTDNALMIHGINELGSLSGEAIGGEPGAYASGGIRADWHTVSMNLDTNEVGPREYAIRYAVIDRMWNWTFVDCTLQVVAGVDGCDGIDSDGDGQIDEDFVSTPTSCGIGACAAAGQTMCRAGDLI